MHTIDKTSPYAPQAAQLQAYLHNDLRALFVGASPVVRGAIRDELRRRRLVAAQHPHPDTPCPRCATLCDVLTGYVCPSCRYAFFEDGPVVPLAMIDRLITQLVTPTPLTMLASHEPTVVPYEAGRLLGRTQAAQLLVALADQIRGLWPLEGSDEMTPQARDGEG